MERPGIDDGEGVVFAVIAFGFRSFAISRVGVLVVDGVAVSCVLGIIVGVSCVFDVFDISSLFDLFDVSRLFNVFHVCAGVSSVDVLGVSDVSVVASDVGR